MKLSAVILCSAALAFVSQLAVAQAPAGSTGLCKDGSYSTAASKAGACRGHKGVQTWYAASAATPAAKPSAPTAAAKPSAPAPASQPVAAKAVAPQPRPVTPPPAPANPAVRVATAATGGGPGMVWVNLPTKVYHCSGTQYYGKTKSGKYMSEADAIAMGAHADHGKACPR